MAHTYIAGPNERTLSDLPPLRPRVRHKAAISAHKPGEWLIRAWCPSYGNAARVDAPRLLGWIMHYTGRFDLQGIEWWGYVYRGFPQHIDGRPDYSSGLTLQRYLPPTDKFALDLQAEGKMGWAYGKPEVLEIPERGVVQR